MQFPNRRFDFSYDPESQGPNASTSQSTRFLKRIIARRGRWILGVTLGVGIVLYLAGPVGMTGRVGGGWAEGQGGDIWEEGVEDNSDGWVGKVKSPTAQPPPPTGHDPAYDHGAVPNHSEGEEINSSWYQGYIPPMNPDLSTSPSPSSLFPEVTLPGFLRPPLSNPFPETRLREVISPNPPEEPAIPHIALLSDEAFSRTWVAKEVWDEPRAELRDVQVKKFGKESKSEKKVREERKEAVKRGFAWAWQGYKDHAWGHDEIKPVSLTASNPFNNWGASIIDTLDTLLLMGFSSEYNLCRPHINQLNLNWINGRDWSQGYTSEPPPTDDEETPSEVWYITRDISTGLPVFETGIRYLGGLLGAYDLSGDTLLLERAKELGDILSRAFNTESGLPAGRIDPGAVGSVHYLATVSIAEVGSMSLELIRLSQATGERKYQDIAQRAMDYLEQRVIPRALPSSTPLIPMWFQPDAPLDQTMVGGLTLGGLSDSYYEYLIKTYKLLGGGESSEQWKKIYVDSVEAIKKNLYVDITVVPDRDLMAIGKLENGHLIHEIEHLTCFAGAMLGLGAKLLDRQEDQVDAERFTESCYWLSAATPTGIQPEVVEFFEPDTPMELMVTKYREDGSVYHPVLEGDVGLAEEGEAHKDREGVWRWSDGSEVKFGVEGKNRVEDQGVTERLKGVPAGSRRVNGRGINRPETIESIFYMYRLTGDRKWQEKGWKMFVSWVSAAKVQGGMSSINDVTLQGIRYGDNMESFMFAETLKYHFLLQSEPDLMSLDDYVLNTEAHPFLTSPTIKPGSQNLWTPPKRSSREAELGVRGQGTDAQKWTRLEVLQRVSGHTQSHPPMPPPAGGKGMGGGGGDPNHKPRPPGM